MKSWLKALFSETPLFIWWILSALSTLSTFFVPRLTGKPRIVLAVSGVFGFAWANFKVFQKQQTRISQLEAYVATHEARTSQLRIRPDNGSRYILAPVGDARHGDFRGGYLEFHLMIENLGLRNSVVNNYSVEIVELHESFPNLRPMEGQQGVQGRHAHQGLNAAAVLSKTGNITIAAENATNHGTLFFFVPDITLEQFTEAGVRMRGEHRQFGPLHCRLTLVDLTGSSATEEFELREE